MSTAGDFGIPGADAFTAFWTEFWKKAGAAGSAPSPQSETFEQMRKAFFDAMARYAEEFMRSEAFLKAMKQSMDQALGWQKMMNDVLRQGLSAAQVPTRGDADHVALLVRGMEERIVERIGRLEKRMAELESRPGNSPGAARKASAARRQPAARTAARASGRSGVRGRGVSRVRARDGRRAGGRPHP